MSDKIFAADTSRFATSNLEVPMAMLQRLRDERNVSLFIPGAWHGSLGYTMVQPSLKNARVGLGMRTATYVALTQRGRGAVDVLEAYKLVGETEWSKLSFVALDMEYGNPLTSDIVANMNDLLAAVDKVISLNSRPILYSAAWWWKGHFGNPNIPVGLPLWNAYYDNDPDFDFEKNPYGGPGVRVVGEQYTNSTTIVTPIGSAAFDFSSFDREWVEAFPAGSNGLALLAQAWRDDMADTIKGAASLHNEGISPLRLAVFGIRQQEKAQAWARLIGGQR